MRHTKTLFATSAIGLAMTMSAGAADLPVKAPIYVAPAAYSWTGYYVGGNAGISVGADPLTQVSQFVPGGNIAVNNQASYSPIGAFGGLQAGVNWQNGVTVLGIEGDIQFSGQRSSKSCLTFCDFNFQNPINVQFDAVAQSIPWFGTLRGRVGYANGPVLYYLTAGLAVANIRTNYSTSQNAPFDGTVSDIKFGVALGGGIEAVLWGNWTGKVEYLYLDYGSISDQFAYSNAFAQNFVSTVSGPVRDHIIRVGVNYRLGDPVAQPGAPVIGMPTKAPPLLATAYNWTGIYIGANAGYSVGRDQIEERTFGIFGNGSQLFTLTPQGALGGGQIGVNWQYNRLVLGLEADWQATGQRDKACFSWCLPNAFGGSIYTQDMRWFATGRGRIGYAAGPVLFYGTGGVAITRIGTSVLINPLNPAFQDSAVFSNSKSGWVAGGGIEAALWNTNWTVKLEYLYMDFGSFVNLFPGAPAFGNQLDPNVHLLSRVKDSIFRAGLNYRFDWFAPPAVVTKG